MSAASDAPKAHATDGHAHSCRICSAPLEATFVDLGMTPLCESFLTADQLDGMEPYVLSAARQGLRPVLPGAAART